jgi:hypothetical protein
MRTEIWSGVNGKVITITTITVVAPVDTNFPWILRSAHVADDTGADDNLALLPFTLLSAPAGSGKTTLLAEWARTTTMPVAWLSLEPADSDPVRFLSYIDIAQISLKEVESAWQRTDLYGKRIVIVP